MDPQLKLWAIFWRRSAAENKSKWFGENGWTSRFCGRNLEFGKSNGRNLWLNQSLHSTGSAMNIIILTLILVVPIIWLYAEFKLGRRARVIVGLISMLCSGFLIYAFCQVKPFYESAWHRNSIRDAENLLKQGHTNVVISAFETYMSIAATNSTFLASERMMHILERGQTN